MAPTMTQVAVNAKLVDADPALYSLLKEEKQRQQDVLELVASENYSSCAILECLGSSLTNKYSEGQIGARYYGGTEVIDEIESLCHSRTLKAFHLDPEVWGVNVQTYSGAPANMAALLSVLEPHDRVMGLAAICGGHTTHGCYTQKKPISVTSMFYDTLTFTADAEGYVDYAELRKQALLFLPKMIIAGTSVYPRHLDYQRFRNIADECGAMLMADISHISGLVATERHPSPFGHCDLVTSTTHKTIRGPRGGLIFFNKKRIDGAKVKVDTAVFPSLQGGPHNNAIAAICTQMLQIQTPFFTSYCDQLLLNAKTIASLLMAKGYKLMTNGTEVHLMVWDLRPLHITGIQFEKFAESVLITVNMITVPGDEDMMRPSGVRIGTPAMTTRGLKEVDCEKVVTLLDRCIPIVKRIQKVYGTTDTEFEKGVAEMQKTDKETIELRKDVLAFAHVFPVPGRESEI